MVETNANSKGTNIPESHRKGRKSSKKKVYSPIPVNMPHLESEAMRKLMYTQEEEPQLSRSEKLALKTSENVILNLCASENIERNDLLQKIPQRVYQNYGDSNQIRVCKLYSDGL